jgi:cytokinin dehydrogenase
MTSGSRASGKPSMKAHDQLIDRVQRDFGHLVLGNALDIVKPETLGELTDIVRSARERATHLTVRGGGSSQSGQCLPDDSVVVDMSGWNQIEAVDYEQLTVSCQPGVTWRELLARTLKSGLVPKVHPLNLDLTVGGTLSAGGLGSTSHRHGFAVSHIASAQVVLGTGELVTTGPTRERDVFDATFGGSGRVGIIGSIQLELEAAPLEVRTLVLYYEDGGRMQSDLLLLSAEPWVYHVGAMCSASVHGLKKGMTGRREPVRRWSFAIELTWRGGAEEPLTRSLERLSFDEILNEESDELGQFLARYDVRFELMRATGAWHQAHPWFEALLPPATVAVALRKIMELPAFFGDGHRVSVVADTERPSAIAFPGAGPAMVVAVLPVGVPEPLVTRALEAIAELDEVTYALGGRRYVSGWLSKSGGFRWERHYAAQYRRLLDLKQRLDPSNLFRSKLASLDSC